MKKSMGITLVALVITIIILIILAGVSISLVLGENGILIRAKSGKEEYKMAQIEESLQLAVQDIQIEQYGNINMQDIIDKLPIKKEDVEWIETDVDEPLGEYEGYEFVVKTNYEIKVTKKAKGGRPEITDVVINKEGEPVTKASITVKVKPQEGRTIINVIEEKSNVNLVNNGDGTYTLENITKNGIYIIKVTDSEGETRRKNVKINDFTIRITVNAEDNNGTTTGSGNYKEKEKIELQATANENFIFKGWYIEDTLISEENPYIHEVVEETTIVAKFEFNGVLISKITLDRNIVKLGKNGTKQLQLNYTVEPDDATDKTIVWEVENSELISGTNGKIVTKGVEGTTKIICKAKYGKAKAECNVEILDGNYIYTREDLEAIASAPSGTYMLMNDIDLSGKDWTPIPEFSGTLDGNGYSINNMKIAYSNTIARAFINEVKPGASAIIKNIKFYNANVRGENGVAIVLGSFSGNNLTFDKVATVGGYINAYATCMCGSLIGSIYNEANVVKVSNCYSTTQIENRKEFRWWRSHGYKYLH